MKKGSALLIVLGMLAFVVASAVAFSAYMRYARMPSSFLRRTSSSRLLAKAALAEAIDIIDNTVGNNAYPGQSGAKQIKNYKRITDDENDDTDVVDYWQDRCFIGSNQLVKVESTVATLCTEALAYIPPPLINEVRYYSRRSVAGMWHTLGFDSGRFAFAAVDVSDYFDINSVRANPSDADGNVLYGRNSSDRGRVTLSHVFENSAHTGYNGDCTPDAWDDFMDNYLGDGKLPLFSLADLSLAMHKQGLPDKMNPFCNYILNGKAFVESETGNDADLLRNMTFVTDSWSAPTNAVNMVDLSEESGQPFKDSKSGATLQQAINDIDTPFLQLLGNRQSPLYRAPEVVQLYDYLDADSVPLSLAMPTVERTPMITGIGLEGGLEVVVSAPNPEVKRTTDPGTPGVDFEFVKTVSTLELRGNLLVSAGLVFPFKYKRPSEGTFKAQAALTVTFVPDDGERKKLRRNTAKAVVAWADAKQVPKVEKLPDLPAYVTALSEMKQITLPNKQVLNKEDDAVLDDQTFSFDFSAGVKLRSQLSAAAPFPDPDECSVRIVRKYNLVADPSGGNPLRGTEVPNSAVQDCGWLPVNANLDNVVSKDDLFGGTAKYYPVVQVWVRIVNADGKTVDLSPAHWEDDTLTGGQKCQMLHDKASGSAERPLLRFAPAADNCAVSFSTANDKLVVGAAGAQATISEFQPKAYLADDPRFNYAPENMIVLTTLDEKFKPYWLKTQRSADADRDGDLFMATSDAGYLQSVYELAYISMTSAAGGDFGVMAGNTYNGLARTDFKDCPANAAMWKTYSQYPSGSGQGYIDGLGVVSGTRGFRISPYTQSENIFLTALANTPLDWWSASTNDAVNNAVHNSQANAAKYSFSEMSGAMVQLKYEKLRAVAAAMMAKFRRTDATGDWRTDFDDFPWDDDPESLLGVDLGTGEDDPKLHSVDRKFLHGFWKECFANKQQLFLIFVRAEPMMMGGGGLGQTPPQLGARAVALVWRDPTKTAEDVSGIGTTGGPRPHRTRVLFYRQFD